MKQIKDKEENIEEFIPNYANLSEEDKEFALEILYRTQLKRCYIE
jgi:hypothetical protein